MLQYYNQRKSLRGALVVFGSFEWVTVCGWTVVVCNQPLRPTQSPILNEYRPVLCGWEGSRRYDVAPSFCHRLCSKSIYVLSSLTKRDEPLPASTAVAVWHFFLTKYRVWWTVCGRSVKQQRRGFISLVVDEGQRRWTSLSLARAHWAVKSCQVVPWRQVTTSDSRKMQDERVAWFSTVLLEFVPAASARL